MKIDSYESFFLLRAMSATGTIVQAAAGETPAVQLQKRKSRHGPELSP
jgi:hypothetical protein